MAWISVLERMPFDGDAVIVQAVGELTRPRGTALPAVFMSGEFVEWGPAQAGQRVVIPSVAALAAVP